MAWTVILKTGFFFFFFNLIRKIVSCIAVGVVITFAGIIVSDSLNTHSLRLESLGLVFSRNRSDLLLVDNPGSGELNGLVFGAAVGNWLGFGAVVDDTLDGLTVGYLRLTVDDLRLTVNDASGFGSLVNKLLDWGGTAVKVDTGGRKAEVTVFIALLMNLQQPNE